MVEKAVGHVVGDGELEHLGGGREERGGRREEGSHVRSRGAALLPTNLRFAAQLQELPRHLIRTNSAQQKTSQATLGTLLHSSRSDSLSLIRLRSFPMPHVCHQVYHFDPRISSFPKVPTLTPRISSLTKSSELAIPWAVS